MSEDRENDFSTDADADEVSGVPDKHYPGPGE